MMTGVMDEDERLKLTPEQELKAIPANAPMA